MATGTTPSSLADKADDIIVSRALTDDEEAAEIETALNDENQTLMMVPTELVPEIVKLINKKRPA